MGKLRRAGRALKGGATGLGVIVITALVGGFVGSLFSPGFAYRALHAIAQPFKPKPLASTLIVSEYMQETEDATFWRAPPTEFDNSAAFMKMHFAAFDPRVWHPYVPAKYKLFVPDVIHAASAFSGTRVEVLGKLVYFNVMGPPMPNGAVEWLLQIDPVTVNDGLLYCRVTRPLKWHPDMGPLIRVEGVIIAVGNVPLSSGGETPGTYMACSSVTGPPPAYRRFNIYLRKHPNALAPKKIGAAEGKP